MDGYKVALIKPDALSKKKIEQIGADSVTKEEIYLLTWRYVFLVKTSLEFIDLVENLKVPSLKHDSEVVKEIRDFLGKLEEIKAGFGRNLASLVGVINKVQINILGNGGGIEKAKSDSSRDDLAN